MTHPDVPVQDTKGTENAAEEAVADAWDAVSHVTAVHEVEWTVDVGRVHGRIECRGDGTEYCYAYCDHECEGFPCDHMPSMGKSCGVVEWFQDSAEEHYDGDETELRRGPIELLWTGDGYDWRFPAAPLSGVSADSEKATEQFPMCEHGYREAHEYGEDMADQVARRWCEGPIGMRANGTADPRVEAGADALRALGEPSQRAWDLADAVLRAAAARSAGRDVKDRRREDELPAEIVEAAAEALNALWGSRESGDEPEPTEEARTVIDAAVAAGLLVHLLETAGYRKSTFLRYVPDEGHHESRTEWVSPWTSVTS